MGRERKHGGGGGGEGGEGRGGEGRFPSPLTFYFALVPISADQTAKNATETLATPANNTWTTYNSVIVLLTVLTHCLLYDTCIRSLQCNTLMIYYH